MRTKLTRSYQRSGEDGMVLTTVPVPWLERMPAERFVAGLSYDKLYARPTIAVAAESSGGGVDLSLLVMANSKSPAWQQGRVSRFVNYVKTSEKGNCWFYQTCEIVKK